MQIEYNKPCTMRYIFEKKDLYSKNCKNKKNVTYFAKR